MERALIWIQAHPPLQSRPAWRSVIPTAVAASGLLLINTEPQCQHQGGGSNADPRDEGQGGGGLLSCLAHWPLPGSCRTPSWRQQRAGRWRWQYHRMAGTSAAPVDKLTIVITALHTEETGSLTQTVSDVTSTAVHTYVKN